MLYSIDDRGKLHQIKEIPHQKDFNRWRRGLSDSEYDAIIDCLKEHIQGSEIQTSSWIPGDDWSGTVYQPIYSRACNYDPVASGLFFGLLVWIVFMEDSGDWSFGRYQKDGVDIKGLTYFKINI